MDEKMMRALMEDAAKLRSMGIECEDPIFLDECDPRDFGDDDNWIHDADMEAR